MSFLKNLKINSTPKTPEIHFDLASGVFQISGVSVPENSMEFYSKIIGWLKEYVTAPLDTTKVIFRLTYVNTSSLQFIYDLLMIVDQLDNKKYKCSVDWYYLSEDIDMKEMGEDFKESLNNINFTFFAVETV